MNSIILKGRLTRDPELRTTQDGSEVASFCVAVPRRFAREQTDFFNVCAWGKLGVFICTYFRKGQEILLEGDMRSRKHQTEDGKTITYWDVNAEKAEFCGSRQETGDVSGQESQNTGEALDLAEEDELPF